MIGHTRAAHAFSRARLVGTTASLAVLHQVQASPCPLLHSSFSSAPNSSQYRFRFLSFRPFTSSAQAGHCPRFARMACFGLECLRFSEPRSIQHQGGRPPCARSAFCIRRFRAFQRSSLGTGTSSSNVPRRPPTCGPPLRHRAHLPFLPAGTLNAEAPGWASTLPAWSAA